MPSAFSSCLDNNWSLSINYLQGKVISVKGDRGEKVSTCLFAALHDLTQTHVCLHIVHILYACRRNILIPMNNLTSFSFCLYLNYFSSWGKCSYNCYCQNYRTGYHRGCVAVRVVPHKYPPSLLKWLQPEFSSASIKKSGHKRPEVFTSDCTCHLNTAAHLCFHCLCTSKSME